MAYMSQEHKKEIAAVVKPILKKYGMNGTLSVYNHSTLVLKLRKGKLDILGNYDAKNASELEGRGYMDVNPYWLEDNYSGRVLNFLKEIKGAMYGPRYFDKSEPMTDYFHCSHYINIEVGQWNKPYELVGKG